MAQRRGLGRGLDALLGASTENGESIDNGRLDQIPVELIQRGKYQPRSVMTEDGLAELAESIKAQGVVQPVVLRAIGVNRAGEKTYELIAGERRWRASQMAGLETVPGIIRDVPDEAAIAMALIENIQRENLNPLEEALALQRLLDEFAMTHQQAAQAVGRSRAAVSNLLRLLELSDAVKEMVERRDLDMGHARALLALSEDAQLVAAKQVVAEQLSVRATESLVRELQGKEVAAPKPAATKPEAKLDPDVARLRDDLSARLGAVVDLKHSQTGKGKLVIGYSSLDELDGILAKIN